MDKDYYQLPYTHEELLELLERIKDLENLEGIQGPPGKDADVSALQQEIAELKSTINELTQVPEIVIANKNIESEMEYLNERTQDENVIGIIVDPYIIPHDSPYSGSIFYFEYTLEFVNNSKDRMDSYNKITTIVKTEDHVYMTHHHLYDGEWSYLTKKDGQSKAIENTFTSLSGGRLGQDPGKALVGSIREGSIELNLELLIYAYINSNKSIISSIELLKIPYSTRITKIKKV